MNDLRILLVEDNLNWQKILHAKVDQALQNIDHSGIVRLCPTFAEAWQALAFDGPWHLLITDIGLGEDSYVSEQKLGIQLADRARELQLSCIVVSGTLAITSRDVRNLLMKHKVHDFFSKQMFQGRQFVKVVESILKTAFNPSMPLPYSNSLFEVDRLQLRDQIIEYFDEGELRSLCFDLHIDYGNWSEMSKINKVEGVITYLHHRGRLTELLDRCRRLRPHLPW